MELTQEEVHRLYHYDPDTGVLTRRVTLGNHSRWKAGSRTGRVVRLGKNKQREYRIMGIGPRGQCKQFLEHRLIWFYMTGQWPERIDHANGDGTDNRWCNLREATQSQNLANSRLHVKNTSGVKGVCWYKPTQKWTAQISHQGKRIRLGYFEKIEDAEAAYMAAAKRLFGEFARAA